MTPDQLQALAARLLNHAAMHDSVVPNDDEQRQWHDDLLDAAEYLRQCAQAEPVAWHYTTVAGTRITHYADRLDVAQLANDMKAAREYPNAHKVTPLYTRPQPQQADVEDDSRWLGPFTTATEALNELRIAVATMMGADPNTWPDHGNAPLAIAAAFGIRQNALERQSSAQADALAVPHPPIAFPFPASYDTASDTLTINGKRYAAGLFDERGLLAPAGTVVRIEDGPDDTVTLTRLQHPPSAQAEPTIDINIKIAVPADWSNRLDMQWIVEREIHADRWSWSYAAPQAMNTQADAIEALRGVASEHDIGYAAGWRSCADEAARIVASHIDRLEPGKHRRMRDALLDLLASMRSILVSQRHNPITDEMNAALRYARAVLAAQGGDL